MRVLDTPMTMPMPASTTAPTAIHCGGMPARLAPYANPAIRMMNPTMKIASDDTRPPRGTPFWAHPGGRLDRTAGCAIATTPPIAGSAWIWEDLAMRNPRVDVIKQDRAASVVSAKGDWEVLQVKSLDDEVFAAK